MWYRRVRTNTKINLLRTEFAWSRWSRKLETRNYGEHMSTVWCWQDGHVITQFPDSLSRVIDLAVVVVQCGGNDEREKTLGSRIGTAATLWAQQWRRWRVFRVCAWLLHGCYYSFYFRHGRWTCTTLRDIIIRGKRILWFASFFSRRKVGWLRILNVTGRREFWMNIHRCCFEVP